MGLGLCEGVRSQVKALLDTAGCMVLLTLSGGGPTNWRTHRLLATCSLPYGIFGGEIKEFPSHAR